MFIGNDGNRDFSKAIAIANNLPDIEFKFITNQINKNEKLGKISHLLIAIEQNLLTDLEIKDLYKNLSSFSSYKRSTWASGQSAATINGYGQTKIISKQ